MAPPALTPPNDHAHFGDKLLERYLTIRNFTNFLCDPLEVEDYVVQTMPDVSPTKWHLAHTTWFFETFVLMETLPGYKPFSECYGYLFNSYYNSLGKQFPRIHRGSLTRPTVREVFQYREYVDDHVTQFLESRPLDQHDRLSRFMETGLNHEQQHQELIVTDIKHVLCTNPLCPPYRHTPPAPQVSTSELHWKTFDGGLYWIGLDEGHNQFSYDNEGPAHRVYLEPFALGSRLITNGEFLAFIEDGGYTEPMLWLSDGWKMLQQQEWTHPLYWEPRGNEFMHRTLHGLVPLELAEPVCHVSHYEADAFARWSGARLPTESEWEVAAVDAEISGNLADNGRFHPAPATSQDTLQQMYGDVWEWTSSPYTAYPGYAPAPGAIGEYNGKFMCNQTVLRGGSCATSQSHLRKTYRNFFPSDARWQFSGIRLARDL